MILLAESVDMAEAASGLIESTILLIKAIRQKAFTTSTDEEGVLLAIKVCPLLDTLLDALNLEEVLFLSSRPQFRADLVSFLASKCEELSLKNRVRLLGTLYKAKPPGAAACAAAVLRATRGKELTALKRLLGTALDGLDLRDLCLNFLKDGTEERTAVLQHIFQEGVELRRALEAERARPCVILSDIDDTCMSSLFDYR